MEIFEVITEADNKITKSNNRSEIFKIVEELGMDLFEADYVEFYLFDSDNQMFISDLHNSISIINLKGLLGYTLSTQKPSFYNYVMSYTNYIPCIDNPMGMSLKSQIIIPIRDETLLIALLRISQSTIYHTHYTQHNLQIASSVNDFFVKVSKVIDQHKTTKEINDIKTPKNETDSTMMFLADAVHDIRTPVNSLYGFLDLLEHEISDKRLKSYISNAKDSAKFVSTITDSILEQTKQNYERQTSKTVAIKSIKYFSQIANLFTAIMTEKGIKYIVYIDPKIPKEIMLDEIKLKRVLINLIGNAHKFTPAGRSVLFRIVFDTHTKLLNFLVYDNGIGISEEQQKHIFKPFMQEDDSSINLSGTGLGLSISAEYVKALGGELRVDSQIGQGSKFYFAIPIEIIDELPAISHFYHNDRVVNILNDNPNDLDALNIQKYLIALGFSEQSVSINMWPQNSATDIICFENSITNSLLANVKLYKTVTFVENRLLSLSQNHNFENQNIIARNSFYGKELRKYLQYRDTTKVLIIDDSKINISLLALMLNSEYIDVTSLIDSRKGFDTLIKAHENGNPFEVLFIDEQMPYVAGSEIVNRYRAYEKAHGIKPIFIVSISGNLMVKESEKSQYDLILGKPFSKQNIQDAMRQATKRG